MKHLLVVLLTVALTDMARSQTFTWQHPLPAGNDLRCTAMLPSGTIFVGGDAGTMLRSTNSGQTWSLAFGDTSIGDITGVCFPADPVGYLCTSRGRIMKTTDGGATWSSPVSVPTGLQSIDFLDADTGLAVGSPSAIFRTTNGGGSWSPIALAGSATLYRVRYVNAQIAYIGTASATPGRLLRSTDGGLTWGPVSGYAGTGSVRGIAFVDPDTGWVATALYEIYRTTNGGASFTLQADPGTGLFYDIGFVTGSVGAAAGSRGDVYVTTNSGVVWTPSPIGYASPLYCLALRESDGQIQNPLILTAGASGALASSTTPGAGWTIHTQALTRYDLRDVQFVDENTGYAVGGSSVVDDSTGVILKTVNGGRTWDLLPFNPKHRVYSTCWIDAQTGFVSSIGPSGVWKTTDGGASFTRLTPGIAIESGIWYSIRFINSEVGFVAGSAGALAKTTNGGATWSELTSGHGLSAIYYIFPIDNQFVVTTGGSGRVYLTTDGGAYWYPIGISGTATIYSSWWANRDTGFVSGSSGTISMTTNRGVDWTPRAPGTTASFYRVFFSDLQHGWACGSLGSIMHTTDGGLSWGRATTLSTSKTLYGLDVRDEGLHAVGTDAAILFGELRPVAVGRETAVLPSGVKLYQNHPNPFNPATTIGYSLPTAASVTITVFNVYGQQVRTLVGGFQEAGYRSVEWDALNDAGAAVASGIYLYRLQAIGAEGRGVGSFSQTRKMVLLR